MIFATVLGAGLGASLASFCGVAATRLPRAESLVRPSSKCGSCHFTIRAYDNVPIVSWIALRGRCRSCAAAIPMFLLCFEAFGALAGGSLAHALFARLNA